MSRCGCSRRSVCWPHGALHVCGPPGDSGLRGCGSPRFAPLVKSPPPQGWDRSPRGRCAGARAADFFQRLPQCHRQSAGHGVENACGPDRRGRRPGPQTSCVVVKGGRLRGEGLFRASAERWSPQAIGEARGRCSTSQLVAWTKESEAVVGQSPTAGERRGRRRDRVSSGSLCSGAFKSPPRSTRSAGRSRGDSSADGVLLMAVGPVPSRRRVVLMTRVWRMPEGPRKGSPHCPCRYPCRCPWREPGSGTTRQARR